MSNLRLGPLPRTEVVRLTIALPAAVKADLDRYAALYAAAYGEAVDAAALVPHMLAAFMGRDRGFRRARQAATSVPSEASDTDVVTAAATASDASSSR